MSSAVASSSVSGLVLTNSYGSCGNAPAKVLIYLLKNKTSHLSAYENHWIGTLAFLSVSFSFAITYHLLPCRQLVDI